MIRNHHQPSTRFQHLRSLRKQFLQRIHFPIHLDAQSLKHLRHVLLLAVGSKERLHHLQQVINHQDGLLATCLHDGSSNPIPISQFAIQAENTRQLLLAVTVHHVSRSLSALLVHTHVQMPVETERETAFSIIEMMRADTQVSQHTIHLLHTIITEEIPQIAEIAPHKREMLFQPVLPLSVKPLPSHHVVLVSIRVLVKTIEMPLFTQSADDFMTVTASAKCGIYPHAVSITDIQTFYTFLQQDRNMIRKIPSLIAHFRGHQFRRMHLH